MRDKFVRLGKLFVKEANVCIGQKTGRKIKDLNLVIGDHAFIRRGTVIYLGSRIGDNFETGHNAVIREENVIGNDFSIWNNSVVDYGCNIGNGVKIHSNCYIAQFTVIEDGVFIAPGVSFANDMHPGCNYFRKCMKGPHICKGAILGVNVTVLPYVTIGAKAFIGAGSVVTKDIPPRALAYGNPARVIKDIGRLVCTKGFTDKPYSEEK
ncbi:N-acetyltransferase [bacterium]|nr:N-acetyltransferase [bacterium]MBU4122772.1 N-acetyltransferase [bacterium]